MGPKKSFNADIANALNPALQFISMPEVKPISDPIISSHNEAPQDSTAQQSNLMGKSESVIQDGQDGQAGQAETNYIQNIAQNDEKNQAEKLAQNQELASMEQGKTYPKISKQKSLYPETKSKRVQLLMKPSLHAQLKKLAAKRKTSLNDLVHSILDDALNNS